MRLHRRPEPMAWCENDGIDYVFGLAGNAACTPISPSLQRPTDARPTATGERVELCRYAEIRYAAKSWRRKRRVVARIQTHPARPVLGVFESMKIAAGLCFSSDLTGLTVAVQGTGNVGLGLCRLLKEAGAKLIIADIDDARVTAVAQTTSSQRSVTALAPAGKSATAYDRHHLAMYAALLDADEVGQSWQDAAATLMRIDVTDVDAEICWRSHMGRARWIVGGGLGSALVVFGQRTGLAD
jgi:hypothetical protein